MLGGRLGGKGVWGRMDTCKCVAESLCCPPKTVTTLLISYTPTLNKKLKNPTQIMVGFQGFPDSSVGKEFACNAGDPGLIPGLGRSAGEAIPLWLSR